MDECEQTTRLGTYLDGEMDAKEAAALEAHLRDCPECAAELAQLRKLSHALRSTPQPELPPDTLRKFHKTATRASTSGVLRLAEAVAGIAAVILLVCVLGLTDLGPSAQANASGWELDAVAATPEPTVTASEDAVTTWMVDELSARDDHE